MKNKTYKVYKHTNIKNNKVYIGITSQENVKNRWHGGSAYKRNSHFHNAIKKYGWHEGFKHEVLFENLSKEEAENKEIELISYYNSTDKNFGYNHDIGGNHNGTPLEETKIKISNTLKGKKLKEETKIKMSLSRTGSKNWKAKQVNQFDMDGNFIKKWECMSDAARFLHVDNRNIWNCCAGKSKTSCGFIWMYC